MSDNRYRLPPLARQMARHMVRGNEGYVDRIYYDSHQPPIPTMAAGISLTEADGKTLWRDLKQRLREQGVDPDAMVPTGHEYPGWKVGDAIEESFKKGGNKENIEAAIPGKPFVNPPPFGVTISEPQADAGLMTAVDRAGGAIRDKFGRDAAGGYYFDKLQPDEQAGLVDAYHNAPGLVGAGVTQAVRDGDYLKAFWEMKENVKDPFNPRRMEEARPFLENHSPVENLFNSDSYTKAVLDRAEEEIGRAMRGGDASEVTTTPVADVGNLLSSQGLPANLLNMSEEDLRRAGIR